MNFLTDNKVLLSLLTYCYKSEITVILRSNRINDIEFSFAKIRSSSTFFKYRKMLPQMQTKCTTTTTNEKTISKKVFDKFARNRWRSH
jgi:hypothetical protein